MTLTKEKLFDKIMDRIFSEPCYDEILEETPLDEKKITIADAHELMLCPNEEDAKKYNLLRPELDNLEEIIKDWDKDKEVVERLKKFVKRYSELKPYKDEIDPYFLKDIQKILEGNGN